MICGKCGHEWTPRIANPSRCAKCKTYKIDGSEPKPKNSFGKGVENHNWAGGSVGKKCLECGAEFSVKPYRSENANYCSLECFNATQFETEESARARVEGCLVLSESGCMEWNKRLNKHGYGQTSYRHKPWLVHRLVWTLFIGNIPSGLCVMHSCDNPKCSNLSHLSLGTHADNMKDMARKGRSVSGGKKRQQ